MAGENAVLHAQERTGTGKGAARQARRNGMVPGIVFGGDVDPLPINIPFNELIKRLKAGRFRSTLFTLKIDGHDDVRVICRDVQRDVVKDLPTHLDLMRLRRATKINLFIHVNVEGEEESPGLKKGGVLTLIRPEVELLVTAGDIPEQINIDVSELQIGDSITISDVKLPQGAKPTIDRDFVIATLSAPSGLRAEDDDEDQPEAGEVPTTEMDASDDA
ncbi:50S ribosomal protein L25/general stress protein Ctc [Pontibaca salina]|uniref:Large ribosomal subunit protein bL25 n=1 Tax=Pontibaca salina TaxID=2795731 RepID=A0A934M0Z3_9RHOB|nr:50S ribosomal protein L25/general stress protein Ctc [Pontibaca salina]MBI6630505.1 50S ribosomal protein L25/general stress protein Ctc [Pontibaca salina]